MEQEDNRIPPRHLSPLSHPLEKKEEGEKGVHRELMQKAEHLLSFLIYASKEPSEHAKAAKMLTQIQCLAEHGCLAMEEVQKAIGEVDDLKSDIHGAASTLSDMDKRLEETLMHVQDTNPKAKLLCLIVDFDFHYRITPPEDLPSMDDSQWEELFKPIYEKLNDPQSTPFQITGINKKLQAIQENFLKDPRSNLETSLNEIQHLNEEILKKSF